MNVTLTLPVEWLQSCHPMYESLKADDSLRRRMVTELLYQCQEHFGVRVVLAAPETAPSGATMRIPVFLAERLARYVSAVAKQSGLMPGATAKALLHLLWKERHAVATPTQERSNQSPMAALLKKISQPAKFEDRPEQAIAFGAIEDALTNGKIGLVEASTGVGKTLAAVFAAMRWIQREQQSCCIAVPTLALLRQVVGEYRRIRDIDEPSPPLRTFFGRREFISQHAAEAFLPTMNGRWPAAAQWVQNGARPRADDDLEAAWLAPELRSIEPDFPIHEITLSDLPGEDDAGYRAYRAQFVKSDAPTLLLCTHAMLAQDMRMRLRAAARDEEFSEVNAGISDILSQLRSLSDEDRGIAREQIAQLRQQMGEVLASNETIVGILPGYGGLIVDEAHLLEQNFSSALSEYLPLRKIVRLLTEYRKEGGKVSAAAIEEVSSCIGEIQKKITVRADFISMSSTDISGAKTTLGKVFALLSPLISVKLRNPSPQRALALAELRRAANLVRLALNQGSARSYMRLSPHRAYPQLYVGRDNVESVLSLLWGSVRAGVALSATLYLYRSTGPHSGYVSGLLSIPDSRRAEYAPIEASWLHDCIEAVDIPTGERALKLRPPTRRDRLEPEAIERETNRWLDEVAKEITAIHEKGKGGTLVLNTSYETVAGLRDRLVKSHPRLISAAEGVSVAWQARQFLENYDNGKRNGERPLWLAVGGAWTGLDVGGHENPRQSLLGLPALEACKDDVMSDLVIPRLPFGTNNSITHLRRILTRPSVPWDLLDAGFRFRQALGRLVRRQGLPRNRRISVLDGRLGEPDASAQLAIFLAPLNRIRDRIENNEDSK